MPENESIDEYVETKIARLGDLKVEGSDEVIPLEIAYETYGTLNNEKSNVILICHALSGDAHAGGLHKLQNPTQDKKLNSVKGWWYSYIGKGKAFNTDKYFIICSNVIGGCMGSTGPKTKNPKTGKPYQSSFPFITIKDMVNAQKRLIDSLGISKLFCIAGGSMGGMQVLQWAVAFPEFSEKCIVLASTSEHSAQQIAFNEVGRQAIISDPNWNNGEYGENVPRTGLALARMYAHITYVSEAFLKERFGRKLATKNILNTDFDVGSYLLDKGESFVDRFDANSYIYVTHALDHFSLGTGSSLTKNLKDVKSEFLVIAYSTDWLYPPYQSREIVKSLQVNMVPVTFCEINSDRGHDSFLIENEKQTDVIKHFLGSKYVR